MIICLGPICFPIWQLFPVLVLLLAKAKAVYYWMIGKPMPVEDGDKKKVDGPNEAKVADAGGSGASSETLRQRRAGGVTSVKSVEDWHSLVKATECGDKLVVDFTATWCKPCKEIAPFFSSLADKYPNACFVSVDVDELDEVSGACGVKGMPTFQVYSGGNKVGECVGAMQSVLADMVESNCR